MISAAPGGLTSVTTFEEIAHVDAGDVRTCYAVRGAGEPLVYLHGAFGDSRELGPGVDAFARHFRVHLPERRGHGRTPDVEGPFTFPAFAADTIAFLDAVVGGPADLVGYSDGATTALHVALERPDLVRRLVLISGQFHQRGLIPGIIDAPGVADMLVSSPLAATYAELSPDGPEHFPAIVEKITQLGLTGPTLDAEQLSAVTARTLVMAADDDGVHLEHTIELYRSIPDSELAIVPGTSHLLVAEKPELVMDLVLRFLTGDPVATMAPIRRAPRAEEAGHP
jgi:pimeloyl-ACP methyl ester carboxylesterase